MGRGSEFDTSVFIVGGGPVGLCTALLLDRFGINSIVIEKNPTTTDHPKSRGCWVRTMEIFRQWGIEDKVRARGLPDQSDIFAFVETVAGHEYGRTRPEPDLGHSPSWKSIVAQDVVEEEVQRVLETAEHARLLFGMEFTAFEDDADGVTVIARSAADGRKHRWRARYLIAADGAGSATRAHADISMTGPASLAIMSNDYWRCDLSFLPNARRTAAFFMTPKDPTAPRGSILNTNGKDRWLSVSQIGGPGANRVKPCSDEEAIAQIRKQVGIEDLEPTLINRSVWKVSRQVATIFRQGRLFLVGDAAHRFPVTGGFGLNTGIQDVHNLAWKLAYVMKGWAADQLLDTYDMERRPIAEANADFSLGNSARFPLVAEAIAGGNAEQIAFRINDVDNHLHSIGQALGFSYESGAVIPDGTIRVGQSSRHYTPSDRPGGRFPHAWLDLSRTRSTLDWFDKNFVLVAGPGASEWLEAGRIVAAKLDFPLDVRTMPSACLGSDVQTGQAGAVLVRPDGHVAWRMPWVPTDPAAELAQVLERLTR